MKDSDRFDEGVEFAVFPNKKKGFRSTTASVRRDADRLLRDLVEMVDVEFSDELSEMAVSGACSPLPGPLPKHLQEKFPFGARSKIHICGKKLRAIDETSSDPLYFPIALRECQFWLAETICHELGHALMIAVFGARRVEAFVRNRWCSEAGHDLVAEVFGGIPMVRSVWIPGGRLKMYFMLQEWPSDDVVRVYLTGTAWNSLRSEVPGFTRVFRLHGDFVADLFREEFWTQKERESPFSTLRPQKIPCWIAKHCEAAEDSLAEIKDADAGQSASGDAAELENSEKDAQKPNRKRLELRMIEHDEDDLDEDIANILRDIIRRQRPGKGTVTTV